MSEEDRASPDPDEAPEEKPGLPGSGEDLLDHLPIDVTVTDRDGRFLYLNPSAVPDPEMRSWLIGRTEHDYCERLALSDRLARERDDERRRVLESGQGSSFEESFRTRSGEQHHVLRSFVPMTDPDGAVRRVLGFALDLSDRVRAEEERRQRDSIYRAMFERNRAVKLLLDSATGRIVDANPAACDFYGWSREELLEKRIQDINILTEEEVRAEMARARSEKVVFFQFRHRLASGEIRDVEVHTGPIDMEGRALLFSIVTDVTERKRAQQALERRESYYRALFQNSLDVITILDRDGRIRWETPSGREITGLDPEERVGTLADAPIHPEDRERVRPLLCPIGGAPGPQAFEFRLRHRDGSWRIVESRASDLLDDPAVRGIVIHSRDITDRRRAEQALRESEARYRRLFQQSKDAVYISNPDGQLLDINEAGVKLFGYDSREQLLDVDIVRDIYVEPWQRDRLLDAVERQGYVKDFETRLRSRSGETLIARATTSAIRDDSGKVVAYLGILRDVTRQRQLEDQLRQSQKMEAVGRLAGGLAHDFNNLLTAINGYADLLHRTLGEERARRFAEEIRKAGKRAAELTSKLLTLSRRRIVSPEVVSLNEVVERMVDLLPPMLGEDIRVATDLAPDLDRVRIDVGQLEQAILNLTVNARDAMPSGGELRFATRNLPPDEVDAPPEEEPAAFVELAVADQGSGVPEEHRDRIFDPFFTTKQVGEGSGLGLSTVYAIVTQSHGHVVLDDRTDGATFRIRLPRFEKDVPRRDPEREVERSRDGPARVLVVEDEPSVRVLMQRVLEEGGYDVTTAADGASALEEAENATRIWDLLISDVVMPGIGGPELADRLLQRYPRLRVLLISGYTDRFTEARGAGEAGHEILSKPFEPRELLDKVREVLGAGLAAAPTAPED